MGRNKGFTLIETFLALGMLSFGALALMKMNAHTARTIKTNEAKADIDALVNQIRSVISDPVACNNTFIGMNAINSGTSLTDIKDALNNNKFSQNSRYGTSLRLESLQLNDSAADVQVNPGSTGDTHLILNFFKGQKTFNERVAKRIRLRLTADATGVVVNCQATTDGENSLWQKSPADEDDLYYLGGNVGINQANPLTMLDINGGLQIGSSSLTCDALTRGSIRFESAIDKIEYCSNTGWKAIGGALTLGGSIQYLNWYFGGPRNSNQGTSTGLTGACPPNHVVTGIQYHDGVTNMSPAPPTFSPLYIPYVITNTGGNDMVDAVGIRCTPLN